MKARPIKKLSRFTASAACFPGGAGIDDIDARPLDAIRSGHAFQRDEWLSGVVGQHRLPDEPVPLEGGVRLAHHEEEFVAQIESRPAVEFLNKDFLTPFDLRQSQR